jgi:hypothetical protein
MKKLAIFVEGLTELIFVKKLLIEIAGGKNICIKEITPRATIGKSTGLNALNGSSSVSNEHYFILIRDCGCDERVSSDIRETCEKLYKANYEKVLGLRDAYPTTDISKLKRHVMYEIPTKYLQVHIILSIMEIEAWFLAETSHFSRIDPSLTKDVVKQILCFDPDSEDVETRPHPSDDLHTVYQRVGLSYPKRKRTPIIERTTTALDYSNIYLVLKDRVHQLGEFIDQIDSFLT